MISVDEALAHVLALASPARAETVPLERAASRVMIAPAVSRMTQPPFDAAAMDGYALRAADMGEPLQIIGESAAGHPWDGTVRPGTAIRIFTGGAVPQGYDRVVMQENTRREGDRLWITDPAGPDHIRPRGGDFTAGDELAAPRRLSASDVGLLAAMNVPDVAVATRPRVAVLATGDELVRPGQTPQPGQIISSNDLAVAGLARAAGAEVEVLPIARDTLDDLTESFTRAADFDLIVTIGGASVGDHDLVGQVTETLGMQRSFYKIAMRPGKPLMAGRLGSSAILGLPGNPVSSIVCSIIFMQPLIRAMQGLTVAPALCKARLARDLPAEGGRQHYQRARLVPGPDLPGIDPFQDQDSSRLRLMADADALLIRPAGQPALPAGTVVDYLPLDQVG